jgi:hypothetical protein
MNAVNINSTWLIVLLVLSMVVLAQIFEGREEHFYEFQIVDPLTIQDMFRLSNRHMTNEFGFHIHTPPIRGLRESGESVCR